MLQFSTIYLSIINNVGIFCYPHGEEKILKFFYFIQFEVLNFNAYICYRNIFSHKKQTLNPFGSLWALNIPWTHWIVGMLQINNIYSKMLKPVSKIRTQIITCGLWIQ